MLIELKGGQQSIKWNGTKRNAFRSARNGTERNPRSFGIRRSVFIYYFKILDLNFYKYFYIF
jgi:hypothetical protein